MLFRSTQGDLRIRLHITETTSWPRREKPVEITVFRGKPFDPSIHGLDGDVVIQAPEFKRFWSKGLVSVVDRDGKVVRPPKGRGGEDEAAVDAGVEDVENVARPSAEMARTALDAPTTVSATPSVDVASVESVEFVVGLPPLNVTAELYAGYTTSPPVVAPSVDESTTSITPPMSRAERRRLNRS